MGSRDFAGGPTVNNPVSNAGDTSSISNQGGKIPHAVQPKKKKEKKTEWISVLASPFPFGCDFASLYLSFPICVRGILTAPTYEMCCVDQMSSFKSLERFLAHRKCLVFSIFTIY